MRFAKILQIVTKASAKGADAQAQQVEFLISKLGINGLKSVGGTLALNIVVLPRNQKPLQPAIEQHPTIPDSPAFADAVFSFEAHIVSSLAGFPNNHTANAVVSAPVAQPANVRALFEALGKQFKISNLNQTNADETARRSLIGCYHNLVRQWSET